MEAGRRCKAAPGMTGVTREAGRGTGCIRAEAFQFALLKPDLTVLSADDVFGV